jgi:CheY-like chemotaxis protein
MREWLIQILQDAGHQVVGARDGLEARSLAKRHALDFVFTDISMPNEDGMGMILAIRKTRPELKIVVISGNDPEILMDAKLLGADATLRKPVTAKRILQCLGDLALLLPAPNS